MTMVLILGGGLCMAMGWYWLSRPEVIVDRLRSRGQFKSSGSRERQKLGTRIYGWTVVTIGGLSFMYGVVSAVMV
jgi:hypothetical protein